MTSEELNRRSLEKHQAELKASQEAALAAADAEWAAKIDETAKLEQESGHVKADGLLCDLLESLGFRKTVAAFKELDKWYA